MPISDWIERLGRKVFESPFGSLDAAGDVPELAEIRLALIDEVKARSHRVARTNVFASNVVSVRLLGVPASKESVFHGGFFVRYCEDELKSGLTRAGYRFPEDLRVEVETSPEMPQPGEKWIHVESSSEAAPRVETRRTPVLTVMKGDANVSRVELTRARTNIGRTEEVYRTDGPSRKNDIAFAGEGDVNTTVSREHAHVRFDSKTVECRLFNDRGANLWVLRDGLSQPVPRDARGFLLRPGDEIHLGRAVVLFQEETSEDTKSTR